MSKALSPVSHTNQENVVQGIHAINLGQQLIHNSIMHAAAAGDAAALLADSINLIEDDDVQLGSIAFLRLFRFCILRGTTML